MDTTTDNFITNSFQTPNAYVDELMCMLTSAEWKIVSYTVRRIFGFNKRRDRISISQYTNGLVSRTGEQLDGGTGLSRQTVSSCLVELLKYRVLMKVSNNNPRINAGAEYALNPEVDTVDIAGLLRRKKECEVSNRAKIQKARSVEQTVLLRSVQQTAPSLSNTPMSVYSTDTQYPVKTQRNTDSAASSGIVEIDLFEAVPAYQRLGKETRKAVKVDCPFCSTRGQIGIFDQVTPCCQMPIKWSNNKLLDDKIKKEEIDAKAAAKRAEKIAHYPPGIRYLIEEARKSEDLFLKQPGGTCKDDLRDDLYRAILKYEVAKGEAFIRVMVDKFLAEGDHGRGLMSHVANALPYTKEQKEEQKETVNGQTTKRPTLQLTEEAKRQLGLIK